MQATQLVLETNMSRLYDAAKGQLEERTQRLTAARLELQREVEANKNLL